MDENRPVSPVNGVPLPQGNVFQAGDEAREAGRKGGLRSAEVRKMRKTLREELLDLLLVETTDKKGRKNSAQSAMSTAMIREAIKGNVRAYEVIRDTIGEKPVEKVMLAEVEQSVIDEVERTVLGDQTTGD